MSSSTNFLQYNPSTLPLVLLSVCKRWHYLALHTPGLFDTLSLRRRVHALNGFDFDRDSWVLYDFLHFPRGSARSKGRGRERGLALQIAYGDIGGYGARLMWADLLRMVRVIVDTTPAPERVYLRLPDDCMEKLLSKICEGMGKPLRHERMKSLTLHSTRERLMQQRYISRWSDAPNEHTPTSTPQRTTTPSSSRISPRFPNSDYTTKDLLLSHPSFPTRTLHVSIFKRDELETYFESCPNVVHLTLELRVAAERTGLGRGWPCMKA